MKMKVLSLIAAALMLGGLATACGDDDSCDGEMPDGVTCQQANGECTALTCIDGDWGCTSDATEVALVPANCSNI